MSTSDSLPGSPRSLPSTAQVGIPPHPLDGNWHLHINGETFGPYSGHQIADFCKEGRIDGTTQVLALGSENWTRASEDRRLSSIFQKRLSPNAVAPPPVNAAAGSTVVQVTNHIAPSPALLMDDFGGFGPKSPGLALFLSFIICGAGQMYCGRVGKGILMLIGCVALWLIFLGWIIWIWSIIDAYATAKDMNLRYLRRLQSGSPA